MCLKQLWSKLFSRNDLKTEVALHSAGATVRHKNPFESLTVPRNKEELPRHIVDTWVIPFYMVTLSKITDPEIRNLANAANQVDIHTAEQLLGDFNWRTRIAGAYFSAINNYQGLEDVIGRHLLKSDVAYAGAGYCLALASFGSQVSVHYLFTYLNYYLDRKDLWFDLADAFCALEYLDKLKAETLIDKWRAFIVDKPNWNLDSARESFKQKMVALYIIRQAK